MNLKTNQKNPVLILVAILLLSSSQAMAERSVYDVEDFDKIIVSPHIKLQLEPGDEQAVVIEEIQVPENKINVVVKGKTLRIYLDKAKDYTKSRRRYGDEKRKRRPMYEGHLVTARVTYTTLRKLSIRGEEDVICNGTIKSDKFRLKVFGEADVQIASIESDFLKTSLYGENKLKIENGRVEEHHLKCFGENDVNSSQVSTSKLRSTSYGESKINLSASKKVKINALGESEYNVTGGGKIYRGIVIGENKIYEYYDKRVTKM